MSTLSRIAVAGATGRVGHHVVDVLNEHRKEVVAMSRATGVDVISQAGLAGALEGADGIIDVSTSPSPEQQAATNFFTTAANNLHHAGGRAGVSRMVIVSIIGCDKYTAGYGAAKAAHEQAALAGPIPVAVLRAAQFHEFVPVLMAWGTQGETCYVPKMRTQLVSARTVAEALVDMALDPEWAPDPNREAPIPEIAGPREESLVAAAKLVVTRRGEHLRVEGVNNPDDPEHLEETGGLLPGPHAKLRGPTFGDWLESQPREALRFTAS
jgi:nucleoside-diphosphate-sugar epimerase